jgi:uncharacterized protein YbjT (DUF2867 family)
MSSKILVTGAAGGVGSTAREAIRILLSKGRRVRAMVRAVDERAESLKKMGAEVVVADLLDIIAVRDAMQGCAVVYFTMSVSASYLEAAMNLAVVAKNLGVEAFVNLSQMTVSQMSETATTNSTQQKQHWLAEQMLRWSGLPVVYLRPTAFYDGLFMPAAKGIREQNAIMLPFGEGKTSPIAGTDAGSAAAVILDNPAPHIGKVYELTGPESMTMTGYAEAFGRGLGRTIRFVDTPPQVFEAKLRDLKLSPHLLNHLIAMADLHRQNRYDRLTSTFKELVGRPPMSAEEFAKKNIAVFSPTK